MEHGRRFDISPALVVAIAGAETTFGIHVCVAFNAWNWFWNGTCSGSPFTSYDEGVETVSKFLRKNYPDKGLNTLALISQRYCAVDCSNWISNVSTFLGEIERPMRLVPRKNKK